MRSAGSDHHGKSTPRSISASVLRRIAAREAEHAEQPVGEPREGFSTQGELEHGVVEHAMRAERGQTQAETDEHAGGVRPTNRHFLQCLVSLKVPSGWADNLATFATSHPPEPQARLPLTTVRTSNNMTMPELFPFQSAPQPVAASRVQQVARLADQRRGAHPPDWPGPGAIDLSVQDLPHGSATLEWWYLNCHLRTLERARAFACLPRSFDKRRGSRRTARSSTRTR